MLPSTGRDARSERLYPWIDIIPGDDALYFYSRVSVNFIPQDKKNMTRQRLVAYTELTCFLVAFIHDRRALQVIQFSITWNFEAGKKIRNVKLPEAQGIQRTEIKL